MLSKIKSLLRELILLGHLQSLGASLMAAVFYLINYQTLDTINLTSIYLVFQSIYYIDRITKRQSDKQTNPSRSIHVEKNLAKYKKLLLLFSIILVTINLVDKRYNYLAFYLLVLLVGVFYPIYFKDITKKVFMFKNFFVAGFYALPLLFLIYTQHSSINIYLSYLFTILVILESLSSQILLDFKDVKADKLNNLLTIPATFGKEKSLLVSKVYVYGKLSILLPIAITKGSLVLALLLLVGFIIDLLSITYTQVKLKLALTVNCSKLFIFFLITLIIVNIYG